MEFRCFIARNYILGFIFHLLDIVDIYRLLCILGISQRDVRSYYSHLHQDKEPIIEDIFNFFETKVCNKLPDLEFCKLSALHIVETLINFCHYILQM